MIDIKETIAVSVLNIVLPRLTLMKFFSFINNYLMNDKFYKSVMKKIKNTDKTKIVITNLNSSKIILIISNQLRELKYDINIIILTK